MAPGLTIDEYARDSSTTTSLRKAASPTIAGQTNGEIGDLVDRLSQRYTNPSLVVYDRRLALRDTPIPRPTPTQVLLRVRCTGICGSDIHLWHRGEIGPLKVTSPCILGHEAAGEVLAVGPDVTNLRVGDRVAVEPGVPCETCFLCRSGRYNLCESVKFAGVADCDGSIRRFMAHEARYCHKIPDQMSFRTAALLEPLAVVMHAIAFCSGKIALGRPVHVCGAGPIGLIALKAARASGAWPLSISDVDAGRLEFAKRFVPGCRTWLATGESPVANAEGVRKLFGCEGDRDVETGVPDTEEIRAPNVVLECTGVESSVATAAYACRRGGSVVVVGVGRSKMDNLPFMHLSLGEIELKFINRYKDMWPAAINVLDDGEIMKLDDLVTHQFELGKAVAALETCADRSSGSIKIHVVDDSPLSL
jgi:L-iditol 2-dehydrogenase